MRGKAFFIGIILPLVLQSTAETDKKILAHVASEVNEIAEIIYDLFLSFWQWFFVKVPKLLDQFM